MKKLLLLLALGAFGIAGTASAQKKSNKHYNDKKKYGKKYDSRHDDRNHGDWDNNDRDRNNNDRYSKNTPRKVRDAFYRDYPNATNVRWTKNRGVWTANFKRSGIFGGNNAASYAANGQRIGNQDNNIFGRRNSNDRTAKSNTQKNNGTWDRITKRNP